jgi:hypothetical protein
MQPQTRSVVSLCVAVAVCGACGGKASDRHGIPELEGTPDPESVVAPVEELPGSLEVLELRRSGAEGPLADGALACEPDGYSIRLKVNFQSRWLISARCEDGVSASSNSERVLDADLARVQAAYDELRVSSAEQCAPDSGIFTLDLSPEHGTHLVYGDDEHSGCPLPGLQRDRFVAGLDELYSVLVSIVPPP